MFGGYDECERIFEEAPMRKLSKIIRVIADTAKGPNKIVRITKETLLIWAEELESWGK